MLDDMPLPINLRKNEGSTPHGMPPIVKLEVHEMKYQIMHHLSQHHSYVEAEVEKQIENAIANYNFQYKVTEAVHGAINRALKNYFSLGDGFIFVSNAVTETLNNMFSAGKNEEEEDAN